MSLDKDGRLNPPDNSIHYGCKGTPGVVANRVVFASKRLWHESEFSMPDGHIVVCKHDDSDRPYCTWAVCWQPELGIWAASWGHYNMTAEEALADMEKRG